VLVSLIDRFQRHNSYSKQHGLYQALKAFGQPLKSLFILRYIDEPVLRMSIEKVLHGVEHVHRFTRAVSVGNPREFLQAEKEDQEMAEACKRLIKNCIICWNYLYLSQKFAEIEDPALLLTAILADATNLGLGKMAESCPGTSLAKLSWLVAWYVRDETYSKALAELINFQHCIPFARHWGEGTTSSSDGQRFRAGGRGEAAAQVNAKYGNDQGVTFYTHLSDQYGPYHVKAINATVRDATHVLDGLLYHESELRIEEHYTDTAGFTDHVFALCHLLGFRFAPRIRDLADKRLYVPDKLTPWPALSPLIGGSINIKLIEQQLAEVLRLVASIQQGRVTASLILRKLGSYPRQNSLALALREIGRIERTLFTLDWLKNPALRQRVNAGLNKGEARNALARAVFFNRLGEIRDRSFENQRHRASGLNLIVAAITLWNTVYLQRAAETLAKSRDFDSILLQHVSPLGWEHVNLTGDYTWHTNKRVAKGGYRPLRVVKTV
jgi:TnpA family transposase